MLKSGGPLMTVSSVKAGTYSGVFKTLVDCQWFVGNDLKSGSFTSEALTPTTPDDNVPLMGA